MIHFKSNRLRFKCLSLLLATLLLLACGAPNRKSIPSPAPEPVKPAAAAAQPVEREYIPHDPEDEIPLEQSAQPEQRAAPARLVKRYTVKRGDTLWGIAKQFLDNPWLWPKVWHINPRIRDPDLIYPGDTLALYDVDGKPFLTLDGSKGVLPKGVKTLKLSPRIRSKRLDRAITTLPRELIAPFLNQSRVVDRAALDKAPYILSSYEGHLISGTDSKVYAMGLDQEVSQYTIVRPGAVYRDPDMKDRILGYEAIQVADARVVQGGQPATLLVNRSNQEILNGDRLLPYEEQAENFYFFPSSPQAGIDARIIGVMGGVSLIGQYSVVVINKGEADGLIPGHVLAIYQAGEEVRDEASREWVELPPNRAGLMMIFRTFNKVSYGLVLNAERSMEVLDRVGNL